MADEIFHPDGTVEVVPPKPLAERQAEMLAVIAATRWQRETGGIIFNGAPIKTDEVSARKLTSAYVKSVSDPAFEVRWKVGPGQFTTLNAAAIIAIGDAVTEHVQQCFDREDVLTAAILDAEDAEELAAIDLSAGWP